MNILFDISHPAHFHLFKNIIAELIKKKHNLLITIRKKDVLIDLLNNANFYYYIPAKVRKNYLCLVVELMERNIKMFQICSKFKPELLVGSSVNITHVGKIIGKQSIVFTEDDDSAVPIFSYLAYPFADKIVNPSCLEYHHWGKKRVRHESYHELAYLHPDNFIPNRNILKKYNLKEKEYIVVRFSALKAYHDVRETGLSGHLWAKIEDLLHGYQVIKSIENNKSHTIDPWDMHHVLSFAKMIISDSQTMTMEGAVLGIPAIRINTFVGRIQYLEEVEKRYKLAIGLLPDQEMEIIKNIKSIIDNPKTDKIWEDRRKKMLSEKEDFNKWMINFFKEILL